MLQRPAFKPCLFREATRRRARGSPRATHPCSSPMTTAMPKAPVLNQKIVQVAIPPQCSGAAARCTSGEPGERCGRCVQCVNCAPRLPL